MPAVLIAMPLQVCGDAGGRRAYRWRVTVWRIDLRWYTVGLAIVPLAQLAWITRATMPLLAGTLTGAGLCVMSAIHLIRCRTRLEKSGT